MQPSQHREDDAFAGMLCGGELAGFVEEVLEGEQGYRLREKAQGFVYVSRDNSAASGG